MGYANDLGEGTVESICPVTGYPRDRWNRLLNPCSMRDGVPVEYWYQPGVELYNLTSPYGHLHFACGTGDDFWCWDYATIECVTGKHIILDATINSETGCFIMGGGYELLPVRSMKECREAVCAAACMVDDAMTWCYDNEVRYSVRGWNQQPYYFMNCVAQSLFSWKFPDKWTERMYRMNTKLVCRAVSEILTEEK